MEFSEKVRLTTISPTGRTLMFPTASCMSSMVWYSYRRKVSNWRKWNIWTSVASCLTHSICASPRPPLGAAASNWSHATAGLACPFGSFGKVPFGQGMSYWIWLKISLNYILKIHHKSLFTRRNDGISGRKYSLIFFRSLLRILIL